MYKNVITNNKESHNLIKTSLNIPLRNLKWILIKKKKNLSVVGSIFFFSLGSLDFPTVQILLPLRIVHIFLKNKILMPKESCHNKMAKNLMLQKEKLRSRCVRVQFLLKMIWPPTYQEKKYYDNFLIYIIWWEFVFY